MNRHTIFNAIIRSLVEDLSVRLNYSELYNKVKQLLGYKVSHRDYYSCLKGMVKEKRLDRNEENMGKKISTVYYSLSSNAIKESQFDILVIDLEKEKLRGLYRLLFLYQALKPPSPISVRIFDRGLSNISVSRKDLVIESHFHILATGYTETNYKPVNNYKFRIVEDFDQGKKTTYYYYKLLSFSLKDIIKYITRKQKTLSDDIKPTPFANRIYFPEIDEIEIKKVFEKLRHKNLIKPIQNIFDTCDMQITFIISDDSLLDLINEIWHIHELEFERLRKKIIYIEQPSEKEKVWLRFVYGDNEASIVIHNASSYRRFNMNNKKINKDIAVVQQQRLEGLDDRINQRIQNINKKYGNIIKKFEFPLNILEDVCLNKIFLT